MEKVKARELERKRKLNPSHRSPEDMLEIINQQLSGQNGYASGY